MQQAPIKSSYRQQVKAKSLPAPMKGLNTAAPITATPEGHALRLENWICRTNGLKTRDGYSVVSAGLGSPVVSIMAHRNRIFASTNAQLFDGATPIPGFLMFGGDWHHALMTNAAGLFLIATNGGDGVRVFDGTNWSAAAFDGVDAASIVTLCVHQSRLWLVPNAGLTIYYLDLDCFAGPVHPVYLQQLARKGGSVAAIASLTSDGGISANDKLVAVTDQGEMILWTGVDPAKDFEQAGVYNVSAPIGRRCFAPYGGGLAYLSTSGVLPIPDVLPRVDPNKPIAAISEVIQPTLYAALATGAWQMAESIENELFIVSGPAGQYVRSGTDGWSSFSGLNATCWLNAAGALYFGTSTGAVCQYGGMSDNGAAISSYLVDRFDRMGSLSIKSISQVRPLYTAAVNYRPRVAMLANYRDPPATFAGYFTNAATYQWEDIAYAMQPASWTRPNTSARALWRSCGGQGTEFSLLMGLQTKSPVLYTGYDLQYETGATL